MTEAIVAPQWFEKNDDEKVPPRSDEAPPKKPKDDKPKDKP